MRLFVPWLVCCLSVACTRDNPTFGADDKGGTDGTEDSGLSVGPSSDPSAPTSPGTAMSSADSADDTTMPQTSDTGMTDNRGKCCEKHDTPGCRDDAIQTCVCELHPSCCIDAWASTCVMATRSCNTNCGGVGSESGSETSGGLGSSSGNDDDPNDDSSSGGSSSTGTGSIDGCCLPHGGLGCGEFEKLETCVCGYDPGCCEAAWDQGCVELGVQHCELECP